ncbi:MAG: hypothetical protein AAGF20_00360 [Pseudomonadota bacterium]
MSTPDLVNYNLGRKAIIDLALSAVGQPAIADPATPMGYVEEMCVALFDVTLNASVREICPTSALMSVTLEQRADLASGKLPYQFDLPAGYAQIDKIAPTMAFKIANVLSDVETAPRSTLRTSQPGPIDVDYFSVSYPHLLDGLTQQACGTALAIAAARSKLSSAERQRLQDEYRVLIARASGAGAHESFEDRPTVPSYTRRAYLQGGGEPW